MLPPQWAVLVPPTIRCCADRDCTAPRAVLCCAVLPPQWAVLVPLAFRFVLTRYTAAWAVGVYAVLTTVYLVAALKQSQL